MTEEVSPTPGYWWVQWAAPDADPDIFPVLVQRACNFRTNKVVLYAYRARGMQPHDLASFEFISPIQMPEED